MDHGSQLSFEQYAADRLIQDREQITRDWVERLASQLNLPPAQVLPHPELLDDIPVVLDKAAEFLLVPQPEKLSAERIVTEEMRSIGLLRHSQGWRMEEVVREFDELAQLLDGAALRWIDDYPGVADAKSVGRVFGRLNRVPLLMGQIMVGALEKERTVLLRQLSAAEEEERVRISRELHDHLGQLVTALILGLKSLECGKEAARVKELERLAARLARETQQLALGLRPPALDRLGLRVVLQDLAGEWSKQAGIECDFHSTIPPQQRFTPEIEIARYRTAQEGLNNILKHAEARSASLVLERRHGVVSLILEDDGRGFDVQETLVSPEKATRLGLRGVRERVVLLGGKLEIESSPGSGTSLFVRIPFEDPPFA